MKDTEAIRVLVVDDDRAFRETTRNLLELESWIELVGMAGDVDEAVSMACRLTPDVIIMDYFLPSGTGAQAAARLAGMLPNPALIMMSVETGSDMMRQSMLSGAKDFLVKPLGPSELYAALRRVSDKPVSQAPVFEGPVERPDGAEIVAVHSPKGGCGVTTVAINLAVAKRLETQARVALVDLSFAYGDVGLMMDLSAQTNIYELSLKLGEIDEALIADIVAPHPSGVKVLLAPPQPQQAEAITGPQVRQILAEMSNAFDYIFVDTSHNPSDVALAAMDMARMVLLVGSQEVAAVRNVKLFMEVAKLLEYSDEKVKLVLNRVNGYSPLSRSSIEQRLGLSVIGAVPEDLRPFAEASSRGVPLVQYSQGSAAARELKRISSVLHARQLLAEEASEQAHASRPKSPKLSLFSRARAQS